VATEQLFNYQMEHRSAGWLDAWLTRFAFSAAAQPNPADTACGAQLSAAASAFEANRTQVRAAFGHPLLAEAIV
jgi:hypothetical protein